MMYRDRAITADSEGLALKWYYFPLGTKHIRWSHISEVREHDMGTGIAGGRWRIWGSGDLVHWMPLDLKRPKKRRMFVLFLEGSAMRPCITPDDPEAFKVALLERGVKVAPLEKPYQD